MSDSFYIIGHRGAAGVCLENTLGGFEHAIALGVDGIELDVQENSGELWVFHDRTLERLSNAGGAFDRHPDPASIRLNDGSAIPTLKKVLELAWQRVSINIEIKAVNNLGLLLEILESCCPSTDDADGGLPPILISSFNHPALVQLHQRGCRWPLAPIVAHQPACTDYEYRSISPFSWHFDNDQLDFQRVMQLREQGILSLVYTVNDPERARELRRRGIAGIFTDLPAEMLALGDD